MKYKQAITQINKKLMDFRVGDGTHDREMPESFVIYKHDEGLQQGYLQHRIPFTSCFA